MADYLIQGDTLSAIAEAIRGKTGDTAKLSPAAFPEAISAIETGSGSGGTSTDDRVKYVTFMYGDTELISYPVISGDTCKNPVTLGLIDTPTKESTVSTVYTFSGWSLTDGGAASSSALTDVTEDRVVYAAFSESARYYTVSFYDGDTLITTQQVAYGGSSGYTYAKDNMLFTGWTPAPTNITGDLACYGEWVESYTFADAGWDYIAQMSESGLASSVFAIGDTKQVAFGSKTLTFKIVAFDHDMYKTDEGSIKTAGITVVATSSYGKNTMNSSTVNTGGWASCAMRSYLSGTVLPTAPEDLQAVIKTAVKSYVYRQGTTSSYIGANSYDKLWLLSGTEAGATGTALATEGTQYPGFDLSTCGNTWLRSIVKGDVHWHYIYDGASTTQHGAATQSKEVVFGFCV